MSKLTSFLGAFGRFAQVKALCRVNGRGIYKRIDENRELLELLQRESPDLMKRCPWIEGWLESQDHFLVELAATVGTKNDLAGSFPNYPRPWPGHDRKGA